MQKLISILVLTFMVVNVDCGRNPLGEGIWKKIDSVFKAIHIIADTLYPDGVEEDLWSIGSLAEPSSAVARIKVKLVKDYRSYWDKKSDALHDGWTETVERINELINEYGSLKDKRKLPHEPKATLAPAPVPQQQQQQLQREPQVQAIEYRQQPLQLPYNNNNQNQNQNENKSKSKSGNENSGTTKLLKNVAGGIGSGWAQIKKAAKNVPNISDDRTLVAIKGVFSGAPSSKKTKQSNNLLLEDSKKSKSKPKQQSSQPYTGSLDVVPTGYSYAPPAGSTRFDPNVSLGNDKSIVVSSY